MAADDSAGNMNPEELKELKELIEFLKESKIGEFDLERGELKVRIKFASEAPAASAVDLAGLNRLLSAAPAAASSAVPAIHAVAATPAAEAPAPVDENAGLHIVK